MATLQISSAIWQHCKDERGPSSVVSFSFQLVRGPRFTVAKSRLNGPILSIIGTNWGLIIIGLSRSLGKKYWSVQDRSYISAEIG